MNFTPDTLATMREVAALLGEGYEVTQPHGNWSTHIENSASGVKLSVNRNDGRFAFSAYAGESYLFTREQEADGLGYRHEITVTEKKSAEQIARDVKRRLLPNLVRSLAISQAHQARLDASTARKTAALEALSAYSDDAGVVCDREGHPSEVSIRHHSELPYGDFKATTWKDRTEFHVELRNVSPELAAQILALVAANR